MKSQGQSQKAANSALGEELKRTLREELTQNFPAEIAAQIQGENLLPKRFFLAKALTPPKKKVKNKSVPLSLLFIRKSRHLF